MRCANNNGQRVKNSACDCRVPCSKVYFLSLRLTQLAKVAAVGSGRQLKDMT